ncbi:hypothetical protein BDP81DRAFT_416194 [Colletotrichum phormii]|uniref:Uncharacterized protein n=1 Tax=Colletotrichum phormii TaxID=359342 RepID=A0AAJ0A1B7_9PEZI|nr:uncharacterized protein BDP81DRAFT_416194 [Colletotrichum phormii]KAK1654643.1 hypothetical protein BDP81DRAFT_416194 [Colletotrichum phormii]
MSFCFGSWMLKVNSPLCQYHLTYHRHISKTHGIKHTNPRYPTTAIPLNVFAHEHHRG